MRGHYTQEMLWDHLSQQTQVNYILTEFLHDMKHLITFDGKQYEVEYIPMNKQGTYYKPYTIRQVIPQTDDTRYGENH